MANQRVRSLAVGAVFAIGMLASQAYAQSMVWGDMDPNKTGVVTAEQHAAYAKSLFDRMDTNHDGKLTKAEWVAGLKSMSAERKQKVDAMRAAAPQKKAAAAAKKAGTTTTAPAPAASPAQ